MPATLKQVELLSRKAGLSCKKAAELWEKTGGDLLQVLAALEKEGRVVFAPQGQKSRIWRGILQKGQEIKIRVRRPEGVLFKVPLILGVAGTAVFPRFASVSLLGLLLARCTLELEGP